MSLLVTNVGMEDHDQLSIPKIVHLTFSNGWKVTYQRKSEEYSGMTSKSEKLSEREPKFDLGDEKVDDCTFKALHNNYERRLALLNEQHKDAFDEAERIFAKEKEDFNELCKRQSELLDGVKGERIKEISRTYQKLKKTLDARMEALNDPKVRLKILKDWLTDTELKVFLDVAQMIESHSGHIIDTINVSEKETPEIEWDCFLSHVQKFSADMARNLSDTLQKEGINAWYDKDMNRLDSHVMIAGVVNSYLFVPILTTDYFTRPFCLLELCVALLARKPIIIVREADPRFGGGHLCSFTVPKLFRHIMQHEIIEINRDYWKAFIKKLTKRMRDALGILFSVENVKSSILKHVEIVWLAKELRKEGRQIRSLLFKSPRDGLAAAFHSKCDRKGATLIVVHTSDGDVFGGFTSRQWDSSKAFSYYRAKSSWLFKLRIGSSIVVQRINIKPEKRMFAVKDGIGSCGVFGPLFGKGHDMCVTLGTRQSYCQQFSYSYGILSNDGKKVNFEVKEMEVFHVSEPYKIVD